MHKEMVIYGLLAEFDEPERVLEAAHKTRAAGYMRAEAYAPFPVHGLAEALGFHKTRVPLIVLVCGMLGAISGFGMCWYANVLSYTWNIGGRPPNSWPAWIPITFELMVLGASFGAVLGMLGLNGLPRPHHPVFNIPDFAMASRNRFFLVIQAVDERFDREQTRQFLEGLAPKAIFEVPW